MNVPYPWYNLQHSLARQGKAWQGQAGSGQVWQGEAGLGVAWQGGFGIRAALVPHGYHFNAFDLSSFNFSLRNLSPNHPAAPK